MNLFKISAIAAVIQILVSSAVAHATPESGFVPIGRGFKNGQETLHLVSVGRRDQEGYRGFDRVQFYYQNRMTGEKSLLGPSVYVFGNLLESSSAKQVEEQLQSFYQENGLKRGRGGANYLAITKMVYRDLFQGDLDAGDVLGLGLILYVTGMVAKNATAEHFNVNLDKMGFAFIAAAPLALDAVFAPFRWVVSQLTSRERFNYLKSGEFKPLREVALENWGIRPQRLRSKIFSTLQAELTKAGTDSLFDQIPDGSFDCGVERVRLGTSERLAQSISRENRKGARTTENPWHRYPYAWESRGYAREELLSHLGLDLKRLGAWRVDGLFDVEPIADDESVSDKKHLKNVCISIAIDHPSRSQALLTRSCTRVDTSREGEYPIHQAMQWLARQWSAKLSGQVACQETRR